MEEAGVLDGKHRFLLCVSGGPDSMALLHLMSTEFPEEMFGVAHLNHGLRKEAEREADLVRNFCAQREIPFHLKTVDAARYASQHKIGLEEAGRILRYQFFRGLKYEYIVTAHHKDDQAETVLGNLIRGCGLHGARGMLPLEGDLLRPLLTISKNALEAYCCEHRVPFAYDASNEEEFCRRNILRHRILPSLAEFNPDVVNAFCRFAQMVADEDAFLSSLAEESFQALASWQKDECSLSCRQLSAVPKALARRVLRKCAESIGGALDYDTTERIFRLGTGKTIPLGRQCFCRCDGTRFVFYSGQRRIIPAVSMEPVAVDVKGITTFPGGYMTAEPYFGEKTLSSQGFSVLLPRELLEQGAVLRSRRSGDWFSLPHRGRKKLSDYLIDEKIPAEQRDGILLLAVGRRILWIPGRRICENPQKDNILLKLFLKK